MKGHKMDETKGKEFLDKYNALCKEHGLTLVFVPEWRRSVDNGDYRLVILTYVSEMPKKEEK